MNVRLVVLVVSAALSSACRARTVDVRTAPPTPQQTQVAVQVNNSLAQGVNVYVSLGGTDTFLRQVAANANATIPVQGFAPGSTVTLRATTVDGTRTYERKNVVLTGTYVFPLP